MNYDKFIEHCKTEGYTWCKIYEGKNLIAGYPEGEAQVSTDDMLQYIDDFSKRLPGNYTIELKVFTKSKNARLRRIPVRLGGYGESPLQGEKINVQKLEDDIRKRIMEELKQKELEDKQQLQINDLKREVSMYKDPIYKLGQILSEMAKNIFPKQINTLNTVMSADNLQGTTQKEDSSMTDEDKLNKAFDIFQKHAEPDFILRLALKIEKDPDIIGLVRKFVG